MILTEFLTHFRFHGFYASGETRITTDQCYITYHQVLDLVPV